MATSAEYKMIEKSSWSRWEHFRHFCDEMPCAISLCDDIDITDLAEACREKGSSLYIALLYSVSYVVNLHEEFRMTAVDSPDSEYLLPAVWNRVDPVHNVFHPDSETYTSVFTIWDPDYRIFSQNCTEDMERAERLSVMSIPCGGNTFEASCIPWRHFTSVNVACDVYSMTPVIAWGKYALRGERAMLPLSIQINHAAADGFHLARFIGEVEETSEKLAEKINNGAADNVMRRKNG